MRDGWFWTFRGRATGRAAALALVVAVAALQGCASAVEEEQAAADGTAPRNTGTFPNLNIVPRGETEQFTAAERAAKMRELAAARGQNVRETARPANVVAERARLARLGRSHVPETLKAIEESE